MAGIGFLLRKLAAQDNLSGFVRAYFHSAIAAVGPWIMIVISINFITTLTTHIVGLKRVDEFLAIVIYNFVFSFIFSAPLYMISARYVSDCLYLRDLAPIPGILIRSLVYLLIPGIIAASLFYIFYADMEPLTILLSVINFGLLSEIWIVMLYLGCIRDFLAISISWAVGTVLTIVFASALGNTYGTNGLLFGLNLGLTFLVTFLKTEIIAEYPYHFRRPKEFRFYFRNYRELFWSGFFLFAGMWIDKILMWGAPEALEHANNLTTYPTYDGAMFLSYLSIVPVMALFIFSLETNFYDSYIQYILHIERNSPLILIEEEKKNIFAKIIENGRNFLVLQGSVTIIVIAFAPSIYQFMGQDFLQIGIFRLGTLGAFFAALNLFIIIIFSYFDSQDNMIRITVVMFLSNALLTLICLKLGFVYYGLGYCLSMILTFFMGATLLVRFLNDLTYHIFITNIVKRETIREHYQERIE